MTGWSEYALALAIFVTSHFLPRVGGLRERLIGTFGRRVYFAAYGMLSLCLLAWLIVAAGRAPYVALWPQLPWTRWVPNVVMPVAFVLAVCGIGLPAAVTLGGKSKARFDPANPGFAAITRHPLFLSLALWSAAHLFPNGDLAHAILFGSFFAMALAAIPAFDAKARHCLGDQAEAYFRATALLSPVPLFDGAWRRSNGRRLALRAVLGLVLWQGALQLHDLAGVSPFPL